jgi:hypothetical protein
VYFPIPQQLSPKGFLLLYPGIAQLRKEIHLVGKGVKIKREKVVDLLQGYSMVLDDFLCA